MSAPETFSLEEYADALLGSHSPSQLTWMTKRLRGEAQPVLPGYKAARRWRATAADIEAAIELLRPKRHDIPELPRIGSMTRTSRRRMASAS